MRRSDIQRFGRAIGGVRVLLVGEARRAVRTVENQHRVIVGRHSYVFGGPAVVAYRGDDDGSVVRVGNFSSIAEGAQFLLGGGHRVDWVSTFPFRVAFGLPGAYVDGHPKNKGDIIVGSDVWIGKDAKILGGVTIGHGAVVGAGAVVGSDVAPYEVVVGNPARAVRSRVTDEQRDALLRLRWWDWPDHEVLRFVDDLSSARVDEFIARADRRRNTS